MTRSASADAPNVRPSLDGRESNMPFTAPVALFFLIAVVLGITALVRRSLRLGYMALGAFAMALVLVAMLALSINNM